MCFRWDDVCLIYRRLLRVVSSLNHNVICACSQSVSVLTGLRIVPNALLIHLLQQHPQEFQKQRCEIINWTKACIFDIFYFVYSQSTICVSVWHKAKRILAGVQELSLRSNSMQHDSSLVYLTILGYIMSNLRSLILKVVRVWLNAAMLVEDTTTAWRDDSFSYCGELPGSMKSLTLVVWSVMQKDFDFVFIHSHHKRASLTI